MKQTIFDGDYVMAKEVPADCDYLTEGKPYEVRNVRFYDNGRSFLGHYGEILNDRGVTLTLRIEKCAHLGGRAWVKCRPSLLSRLWRWLRS